MKKQMTIQEKNKKKWATYEKRHNKKIHPIQDDKFGKKLNFYGVPENINEFCPTMGCNLFNQKDICKVLVNLEIPFSLRYWSIKGRDSYCQFELLNRKEHVFSVSSSGYGKGEFIRFSKKFDETIKFNIMRQMAHDLCIENYNSNSYKDIKNELGSILELIINEVSDLDELKTVTKIYHGLEFQKLQNNKEFKRQIKKDKTMIDQLKTFKKEWDETKRNYLFIQFKNFLVKINKENKQSFQKQIEKQAKKLHVLYLEATKELNPESFNPKAQKPYSKLTKEQKFIDKYIAEKILKDDKNE